MNKPACLHARIVKAKDWYKECDWAPSGERSKLRSETVGVRWSFLHERMDNKTKH